MRVTKKECLVLLKNSGNLEKGHSFFNKIEKKGY